MIALWRQRAPWMAMAWLAACSAPQAWQPAPDFAKLAQQIDKNLPQPAQAGAARRQLAWLCLLHGRQCERAAAELASGDVEAPAVESALLHALLRDGQPDAARAAQAWLQLAAATATMAGETAQRAGTFAFERAAALGQFDAGAAAAVGAAVRAGAGWDTAAPLERFRRVLAEPHLGPAAVARAAVTQDLRPWTRRMHAGWLWDARMAIAPPPATEPVPLPDEASAAAVQVHSLLAAAPGVYAIGAEFSADGHPLVIGIDAPGTFRAWLDGRPLGGEAPIAKRLAVRTPVAAGRHLLQIAAAVATDGQRLRLWLGRDSALPQAATGVVGSGPDEPPTPELLQLVAANGEAVGGLAERFENQLAQVLAALAGSAPSGDAVDRALDAFPQHVGALMADIERQADASNGRLALQLAGRLPKPARDWLRGELAVAAGSGRADVALARARALQAAELHDLAAAEAAAAARLANGHCGPWLKALQLAADVNRSAAVWLPGDASNLVAACRDEYALPDGLQAAATLQAARGTDEDEDALLGALERRPVRWRRWAAEPRPNYDRAPAWATATQWRPLWANAQRQWRPWQHQAAQDLLDGALLDANLPLTVKQKAMQAGAAPPWQKFVRDGAQVAAAADDPQWAQRGERMAWLLDQELLVLLPGGGAVRRVHQVLRVLTDDAAEDLGEVRIAEGAELELARTLLADGTVLPPAEIADKQTVSLRAVSAGAAIEYAQVQWVDPDDPPTGATHLAPFLLQAGDGPLRLSEYVVLAPPNVTPQFELSPAAPKHEIVRVGAWTAHIFRTANQPRSTDEPRAVRPQLSVPSVQLAARAALASTVEPWDETLAAAISQPAAPLAALARAVRQQPAAERWQWLASKIGKDVANDHEGGPPGDPAAALDNQKGDRAALFYAAARLAGADACLVRANPLLRDGPSEPPRPSDYTMQLVAVALPGAATLWYDPGLEGGILDHVRSGLRGRPALLCGCAQSGQRVTVPDRGARLDRRQIAVRLAWQADGAVAGEVTETFHGAPAAFVRQWLDDNPAAADRAKLAAELGGQSFPGMALTLVSVQAALGKPTVVRYAIAAPADAGRAKHLDLQLYPSEIAKNFAVLPVRKTPMSFGYVQDISVAVDIDNQGAPVSPLPAAAAQAPLLRFNRAARQQGPLLHIEFSLVAETGIVHPGQYAAFAAAAREADAAELVRLSR